MSTIDEIYFINEVSFKCHSDECQLLNERTFVKKRVNFFILSMQYVIQLDLP